jgi:hypothetical protein
MTNTNQLITIVGFSPNWMEISQLSKAENSVLEQLHLKMSFDDPNSKVVGLYFDPQARERQELI